MHEALSGEKTGIATVLAEEFRPEMPVPGSADGEQLALLPLSQVGSAENNGNSVLSARGAGRPPGAKNKNTEVWRTFLLSKYRSPLEGLAEIYSRPISQLATDLGLKSPINFDQAKELLKIQIDAMVNLAPYVHQKMPMALDTGDGGLISLTIINGNAQAVQAASEVKTDFEFIDLQSEENQELSEENPQKSNGQKSNDIAEVQLNPRETTGTAAD